MGRFSAAATWLLTRALVLWLFFGHEAWVTGDVAYFAASLSAVPEVGLEATLVEYPLPGVVLVALPWLVAEWVGAAGVYAFLVMVLALVTDAAFTALLHHTGRGRRSAMWTWLLAVPLLGATTYARFDLVPGILAGTALLLLAAHPRVAAVCGAVATGLKFWPALLLPALAAPRRSRGPVLIVVALVGVLLAGASVVVAGWSRLVSPLTWQGERGLQVESVAATPAMLGWAIAPERFTVGFSEFNAFEVHGPGADVLLRLSQLGTLAVVVGLAVLWVRALRLGDGLDGEAVTWTCLAAVTGFLVTSKVLSPQYLLWLLPLAAAGLVASGTGSVGDPDAGPSRRLVWWSAALLAATAATHLVFPTFYGGITTHQPWSVWVVALLAARNLVLVWLLVHAAAEAWLRTSPSGQRGMPLDRQPPGPAAKDARTLR
ncbi:MAG TPA: glycosyltransferase 87 family protein [Nocardioidaceae bacterium]|nr:glycosyltransferase 87 family protein [Nocardioidaceae bacterium]